MLRLFIFRFWPVLIPLIVYWLWFNRVVKRAKKDGTPIPRFRDGPVYWAVLASLVVGVACFALWGASDNIKGEYIPPHMENGMLVPGHVVAKP